MAFMCDLDDSTAALLGGGGAISFQKVLGCRKPVVWSEIEILRTSLMGPALSPAVRELGSSENSSGDRIS